MPGLKLFTSNRLENLAKQLSKIIARPVSSPLAPEIVVVQSRGMGRWLSMEIAQHTGICANISFPFPEAFFQDLACKFIPDLPDISPFNPEIMTFKIMAALPSCLDLPGFESIKAYFNEGIYDLRLYQLSQKIADTFEQYIVYRPDMIFGWEEGKNDIWQAKLWRIISSGCRSLHRARIQKDLTEKIMGRSFNIENLYQRVSIFGISYLPPFYLNLFAALSSMADINFFLLNPCSEYWGDIVSDQQIRKISKRYTNTNNNAQDLHLEKGNALLSSLGALGRDFFEFVYQFESEVYEDFQDPGRGNVLRSIQSDILYLKDIQNAKPEPICGNDTSIQIHSCHSPMREIEVLHDNMLSMFEQYPDLLPKDILVMTTDIELYAPFIHAVFGTQSDDTHKIPYSIADQSARKESRIIDTFMALLDLKGSRLGATEVTDLLQSPGIMERFGIASSEIDTIEHWINDLNIRWGRDDKSRIKLGLPGIAENTWKAGIERLLLGYALPGKEHGLYSEILPYDNIEGENAGLLGRFLEFLDAVFSCTENLNNPRTLNSWAKYLNVLLEKFFILDDNTNKELVVILRLLESLIINEDLSGYDKKIDLEVIKTYLEANLKKEVFVSGFLSGGVTFCETLPMRSIPFKVICLIGMNSDAFPRETELFGFDLIKKNPKPLDRSKRNDDKYFFLEALISAKNKLYISYVGQSIRDNTQFPPSAVVSELVDYIKKGFFLPGKDIEGHLITKHRLQPFSYEYFKKDSKLFSYSKENYAACCAFYKDFDTKKPPLFIASKLSSSAYIDDIDSISIDTLSDFFINTVKFLLENRFGIYLKDASLIAEDRENFKLDGLELYLIGSSLVDKKLSGIDFRDFMPVQKAMGQLPHGNIGEYVYNKMSIEADLFAKKIKNLTKGDLSEICEIDLDLSGIKLSGILKDVYNDGIVKFKYAKRKSKDILRLWIYHLVLCEVLKDKNRQKSALLCKDTLTCFSPVKNSKDILIDLIQVFKKGMSQPIFFFPESSFKYTYELFEKKKPADRAITAAQKVWEGSDHIRGESEDPYFKRCFGNASSESIIFSTDFQIISERIFSPLLQHFSETKN